MSTPAVTQLRNDVHTSLTSAGFEDATAIRQSDSIVIATVPAARETWAAFALAAFRTVRLADKAGRARYAVATAPEDTDPYTRAVHFRATGPGLAAKYEGKPLYQSVQIVPGYTTESDIPKVLATYLFGNPDRAADITVTDLL
ncbi:hypothetical protein ACIQ9R_36140 [Streptomyces sp. NPDC094447]|uniref:hypothetical protein n=1 Tax=Streptomyces sp. NPDC094447 TaxID=3366062 RepID=UPI0037F557FD